MSSSQYSSSRDEEEDFYSCDDSGNSRPSSRPHSARSQHNGTGHRNQEHAPHGSATSSQYHALLEPQDTMLHRGESPGWIMSPLHGNGTVEHKTPQLDSFPVAHQTNSNADLFGVAASRRPDAHESEQHPSAPSDLWKRRGRGGITPSLALSNSIKRPAKREGANDDLHEIQREVSEEQERVSAAVYSPAFARVDSNGRGSVEERSGWSLQHNSRTVRRQDSAMSSDSFKSARGSHGIAGSGEESGWSDGGDRHRPLRNITDDINTRGWDASHRRADLFNHPPSHTGTRLDALDDNSVCSSNSSSISSSASGSTVSSQSSWSSSGRVSASSRSGGWGRRLRLWGRSGPDGIDADADSAVLSLEELQNLNGDGSGGRGAGREGVAEAQHDGAIWIIRASADASLVATAGQCGVIYVWHVAPDKAGGGRGYGSYSMSNTPVASFRGHTGAVVDLAWSKDLLLVSASLDSSMRVWHTSSPMALRIFTHSEIVTSVMFHPLNQQLVFSGCLDGHVRLWDLRPDSGAQGEHASSVDTMGIVTALAISDDGKTMVVGLFEGKCLFYDVTVEKKKIQDMRGHKIVNIKSSRGKNAKGHKITGLQYFGNTPYCRTTKKRDFDARLLVSTIDSRLRLYRVADMSLVCKYKGHSNCGEAKLAGVTMRSQIMASMSPDMSVLASPSEDGSVYVWSRVPPSTGLFRRKPRNRHSTPLSLDMQRRQQAGGTGTAATSPPRFSSALAFLPHPLLGAVSADGSSQIVNRVLVVGMSNGDLTLIRVTERVRIKSGRQVSTGSNLLTNGGNR